MTLPAKNVIVIGMARSGTSLTASVFASQGYYVDEAGSIADKDHMNPKGYWESNTLVKNNESIVRSTGFEHDNTWIYSAITSDQIDKIEHYSLSDDHVKMLGFFSKKSPWVWKDPRLCYTLGCWWPYLDQENTVVILVTRDKQAIYNSFVRVGWRKNSSEARSGTFERIAGHIENAERIISLYDIPVVRIDYSDYGDRPMYALGEINRACGLDLSMKDIGYEERYNHHNLVGRVSALLDRLVSKLPHSWIKFIKMFVPKVLLSKLYPERYD
jgi:hypothetical protein